MIVVCQTAVSCGENQLISIPPMHIVFQTAVSCGGNQLIGWETRVASLGDFSPKNANLGTYRNQEIFRGILKINFEKVVLMKNMRCIFRAQTKHSSLLLKLFSERRSSFLEKL
jgi:hypothetical protein